MNDLPDLAIRLRRAAFNRALAEGDLGAIGGLLAPGAVMVTGSDSGVIVGRKAQLLAWKREFGAADRTVYTRTPDKIVPSAIDPFGAGPMALEHGNWEGVSAVSGLGVASGQYTAKWRKIGPEWMIEAEIYLTLA